jgi:hypothetical protein
MNQCRFEPNLTILCRYLADVPDSCRAEFCSQAGAILVGIWSTIAANMSDLSGAQAVLRQSNGRNG